MIKNKPSIVSACLILMVMLFQNSVAQTWDWVHSENGSGNYDFVWDMVKDSRGDFYVGGQVGNNPSFGNIAVTNHGTTDFLVAKFDTLGNWKWVRNSGSGTSNISVAQIRSLFVDSQDNIYAGGIFHDTLIVGNDTLIEPINTLPSGFIMKMDTAGNYLWARAIPSSSYCEVASVGCDANGDIYIGGNFQGSANWGTFNFTSHATIQADPYVAKLDAAGNWLYVNMLGYGTNSYAELTKLSVSNNGNIAITGTFTGTVTFGSTTLTNTDLYVDAYTASANSAGNWLWAKQYYSTSVGVVYLNTLCTDKSNGYIYNAGHFNTTVIFDTDTITANGNSDCFITKTDSSGNLQWVKTFGVTEYIRSYGLAVKNNGNLLVVGYYADSALFDNVYLTDSGGPNHNQTYCAELSSNGNWLWALGSNAGDMYSSATARTVTEGNDGNVYLSGASGWTTNFGNQSIYTVGSQIYIAKIDLSTFTNTVVLNEKGHLLQVSPNPFNGFLSIYYPDALTGKTNLYLYNTEGQCIFTKKNIEVSEKINITDFPPGLYFLKINDSSLKIIKQ